MKTKSIKTRVAKKTRLPSGAQRFPESKRNGAKALEAATEKQVEEMERTFSNRWEW